MNVRHLTAAALLALTASCSSLLPVAEPAAFIAETNPPIVYVTNSNGVVLEIVNPRADGDSLRGVWTTRQRALALPWRDVQRVSTFRLNRGRTVLFLAGITAASSVAVYALTTNANGHNQWTCDYNTNAIDPTGAPRCGAPM